MKELQKICDRLNKAFAEEPEAVRALLSLEVPLTQERLWGLPGKKSLWASWFGMAFGVPDGGWTVAWVAAGQTREEAVKNLEGFTVVNLAPHKEGVPHEEARAPRRLEFGRLAEMYSQSVAGEKVQLTEVEMEEVLRLALVGRDAELGRARK